MTPFLFILLTVALAVLAVALCAKPNRPTKKNLFEAIGAVLGTIGLVVLKVGWVAAAVIAPVLVVLALGAWYLMRRRLPYHGAFLAANIGIQTHETGHLTKLADATIATRYLLVKQGTDVDHVAVAGASDFPFGVAIDSADVIGDPMSIGLLGNAKGTIPMVASAAIAANAEVYTAAGGQVSTLSATAATYYKVGRACNAAGAAGDLIEVQHCYPVTTVVS